MGTRHKFEDLTAEVITLDEEDIEIDTSEIYYKLIQVDLHQTDVVSNLEKAVNEFIENTSDNFIPTGQPFVVDNVANKMLVQMLMDVENLQ